MGWRFKNSWNFSQKNNDLQTKEIHHKARHVYAREIEI